jgi:uncharacterized protein with LGFP repeats
MSGRRARIRWRPALAAGLAALLLTTGLATGTATAATTAEIPPPPEMFGYDVSWPQCPAGSGIPERPGYGLPLPPASSQFVIIGLTNGPAFTPNPCLADQVGWAKAHLQWAAGYAVVTYPTAAQLATYGGAGPYPTTNSADRLRNVGYAQAVYNLARMREAGLNAKFVWVDVEPYPVRPWSSDQAANNAVIDGVLRGYQDGGFPTGFYSYDNGWREITGGRRDTVRPTWVPAGRRTEADARAKCTQPSFSGGPVVIGQWTDGTYDYNVTCPGKPQAPYFRRAAPTAIESHYAALGSGASVVGLPGTEERVTPDRSGAFAHFARGSIYWSPSSGAREVHGAIRDTWASLGWERSLLRYPVTDERGTPDGRGRFNHFQAGSVYWTATTGAQPVHGAIRDRWQALGWERSGLGYPTTGERTTPDGRGRFNHFEGGSVYWTAGTGAQDVQGPIRQHWAGLGWERGLLGYPVTGQRTTPDGRGRFNHFQGGSVYWTAETGAREVHGAIRDRWQALGWERSGLGYPTTDERGTPDGRGRFNHFQGGSVYWTAGTGAQDVQGPIRQRWQELGWERGLLGYPVTGQRTTSDGVGRYSQFQGGAVYWTASTGAHEVYGAIRQRWVQEGAERGALGYPTSGEYDVPGGRAADFQHGRIVWDRGTGTTAVQLGS